MLLFKREKSFAGSLGPRKDPKAEKNIRILPSGGWINNFAGHSLHQDYGAQKWMLNRIEEELNSEF